MTTATQEVSAKNPFRIGTKLYRIFDFLTDMQPHTLMAIASDVHDLPGEVAGPILRRRTSSAIRTVRKIMEDKGIGTIAHSTFTEEYKLVFRA